MSHMTFDNKYIIQGIILNQTRLNLRKIFIQIPFLYLYYEYQIYYIICIHIIYSSKYQIIIL